MHLDLIESLTIAGTSGGANDDRIGLADAHAWVIDGCTDLGDPGLLGARGGAAWIAGEADRAFAGAEGALGAICSDVFDTVARRYAECRTREAEPWELPSAAFLAVTVRDATLECAWLGDCPAVLIRGGIDAVWRAHHEPELLQRWLLGPEGWTMPVCEVATEVGQTYRYEWAQVDGEGRFGFTGELLESLPPHRAVTTEAMIGTDGPGTTNELTLTPVEDGTLLSLLITYPSAEVRDAILATGMTDGMETSYKRLDALVG